MAPSTRTRHGWHAPEKGSGPAFALSLLAHAGLFIAIAFMVRWKSEPVGTISAELWSLPPAALPQPTPVPPPQPRKVEPPPPQPEPRKADIVLEQKKAPPPKADQKKVIPADLPKKDDAKADAKKVEADRQAAAKATLDRMQAQAGPGTRLAAAGGSSDAYAAQINSCIRPHIIFNVPEGTRPRQFIAEFEVALLPTGEQIGAPKLIKASGLAAYDQAVERAIRRCDPFPRPKDSAMPRSIPLTFDPVER
ncbi:MAG: TonB C-terminal domain-containing protein [Burkholderiaceae bacterium]|nr:TonB C-terminal domain-containing protein [Burkholderiaceae bacterium]